MNDQQLLRYNRQIVLDGFDTDGQERLLTSHVLVVGMGGLGSPAASYLASAGIGQLTVCDHISQVISFFNQLIIFVNIFRDLKWLHRVYFFTDTIRILRQV